MGVDDVKAMTLLPMLNDAGLPTQRSGFQRWLTPVGIYHRKRLRYGQLFCQVCLTENEALLPLEWRLASTLVCIRHNLLLRDSCPCCDAPFAPYRRDALTTTRCDRCAARLSHGLLPPASNEDCSIQIEMRSMWESALGGNNTSLESVHRAMTVAATQGAEFRRAGEPWTYWRLAERRLLLHKVVALWVLDSQRQELEWIFSGACPAMGAATGAKLNSGKKQRRRRCELPKDPSSRAAVLLKMAARVKFPRRPKSRISKTA